MGLSVLHIAIEWSRCSIEGWFWGSLHESECETRSHTHIQVVKNSPWFYNWEPHKWVIVDKNIIILLFSVWRPLCLYSHWIWWRTGCNWAVSLMVHSHLELCCAIVNPLKITFYWTHKNHNRNESIFVRSERASLTSIWQFQPYVWMNLKDAFKMSESERENDIAFR